jgi:hypothetical protein
MLIVVYNITSKGIITITQISGGDDIKTFRLKVQTKYIAKTNSIT